MFSLYVMYCLYTLHTIHIETYHSVTRFRYVTASKVRSIENSRHVAGHSRYLKEYTHDHVRVVEVEVEVPLLLLVKSALDPLAMLAETPCHIFTVPSIEDETHAIVA